MKHSYRDVGRKKFHFCLSFLAVLIVVWSALIINTVVEKGPIIFLKIAQGNEGQYDGIVSPSINIQEMTSFDNQDGVFINYERAMEVTDNKYNLAPRKQFCGTRVASNQPKLMRKKYDEKYMQDLEKDYTSIGNIKLPPREKIYSENKLDYSYHACIMFFDTEMERKIDLGIDYKFAAMNMGECLINK